MSWSGGGEGLPLHLRTGVSAEVQTNYGDCEDSGAAVTMCFLVAQPPRPAP